MYEKSGNTPAPLFFYLLAEVEFQRDIFMKKLTPFLLTTFVMLGAVGCSQDARTSSDAPNSTTNNAETTDGTNSVRQAQIESDRRAQQQRDINNNAAKQGPSSDLRSGQVESDQRARDQRSINDNDSEQPASNANQSTENDANSDLRQRQIESDQRARDQRNDTVGNPQERSDGDLQSLVRNKLETSIPNSKLTVDSDADGIVTITGTVSSQEELDRIESLAKEVQGVKGVNVQATVIDPANPY